MTDSDKLTKVIDFVKDNNLASSILEIITINTSSVYANLFKNLDKLDINKYEKWIKLKKLLDSLCEDVKPEN